MAQPTGPCHNSRPPPCPPLPPGKSLFTYAFFDRQRPEAQAFFADIYSEAVAAEPAAGHHALRQLHDAGRLLRHYTLNIDGLAEQAGGVSGAVARGLVRLLLKRLAEAAGAGQPCRATMGVCCLPG